MTDVQTRRDLERYHKLCRQQIARSCRRDLTAWAVEATAELGYVPARHHRLIIEKLEAVSRGHVDRLMVFMPPRHGKSEYISRIFPAWWFTQHKRSSIIAASHTMDLAEKFGRKVRNLVAAKADVLGYGLRADSTAAGRWNTNRGGEYMAAGVGKAISGNPADLFIIDDPVDGSKEAASESQRDSAWEWYTGDVVQRLQPGGRVILVMTRWHPGDLAGRLLDAQAAGGDRWDVLMLPALADSPDDALGRAPGEALWPEWMSRADLLRRKANMQARSFAALYQQAPRPPEGSLFLVDKIGVVDSPPPDNYGSTVRAWDLAATEDMGTSGQAYTVGVKLHRSATDRFTVCDVVRFRGGPEEVEGRIVRTAQLDGRAVKVCLPQDPGQAGKAQMVYYSHKLLGFDFDFSPESGDKVERANPVAAQVNVGNFDVVRDPRWNSAFLEELAAFPASETKDQVDALSRAFMVTFPDSSAVWRKLAGLA